MKRAHAASNAAATAFSGRNKAPDCPSAVRSPLSFDIQRENATRKTVCALRKIKKSGTGGQLFAKNQP